MITEHNIICSGECKNHHNLNWSAVFAGGLVGVGLGFLLHLFGIAIGLSAYSLNPNGAYIVTIGGLIGLIIGAIASMGAAGYVAGHLGTYHHCQCHGGIIYGFLAWSMVLVLSALLVMPMTRYVSYYKANLIPNHIASVQAGIYSSHAVATQNPVKSVANKVLGPVTPTDLAWGGWLLFSLFFIGALASCIGAYCGMCCKKEVEPTSLA
jgi:uncharacterized membrane-anchored protein YitT (DUF2179 family)